MKYIECPEVYENKIKLKDEKSLFLAGGISGCSDWQAKFVAMLNEENIVLLNPRRKHFDVNKKENEKEQITWEYNHLAKASAVSFWFPSETVCPITLYELGKQSADKKPIFIGVDPNYSRKRDVEIQIKLARPEIVIGIFRHNF